MATKYYTCKDVAEKHNVKLITVWDWVRKKKIKAIKLGRSYSISPQALAEFEESRMTY